MNLLPLEKVNAIVEAAQRGLTVRGIAAQVGVSCRSVMRYLKQNGFEWDREGGGREVEEPLRSP